MREKDIECEVVDRYGYTFYVHADDAKRTMELLELHRTEFNGIDTEKELDLSREHSRKGV